MDEAGGQDGDLKTVKERVERYPGMTYLVRHRFRDIAGVTIFVTSLIVIFGSPFLSPTSARWCISSSPKRSPNGSDCRQ